MALSTCSANPIIVAVISRTAVYTRFSRSTILHSAAPHHSAIQHASPHHTSACKSLSKKVAEQFTFGARRSRPVRVCRQIATSTKICHGQQPGQVLLSVSRMSSCRQGPAVRVSATALALSAMCCPPVGVFFAEGGGLSFRVLIALIDVDE